MMDMLEELCNRSVFCSGPSWLWIDAAFEVEFKVQPAGQSLAGSCYSRED